MLIKEEISEQDSIDIGLEVYNLVGMTKKKILKARLTWGIVLVLGIIMIVFGFNFLKLNNSYHRFIASFLFILGAIYCLRSLFAIIFMKRIYKSRLIKSLKKYYATARQKYNINDNYEETTEIKDGYLVSSSLDTITKYSLKDYIRNFENEKFYILEFTNGRFIFLKKQTFENKEKYDELIKEIETEKIEGGKNE